MSKSRKDTRAECDKERPITMDYISPEELRAIWEEQSSQDCNEVDFIKREEDIKTVLLSQISYWFSVVKKTRIPEHITIQSYALYLIR